MALNRLGYNTYHMVDVNGDQVTAWGAMQRMKMSGKATEAKLARLEMEAVNMVVQDGYTATSDFPASTAYRSFLKKFPTGKVKMCKGNNKE